MSIRLQRFMCHTCDLYRPAAHGRAAAGLPEASDFTRSPSAAYTGVLCHFQSTQEFDEPRLQGVSKETNVLTSDVWHFLASQEIGDTWMIVLTTGGHPDNGKIWITQGNSQSNASQPGRPANSQSILAKLDALIEIPS